MVKKKLAVALAALLLSVGAFALPALAKDGVSGSDDTALATASATESKTDDSSTRQEQEAQVEQETNPTEVSSHKDALETETETEINDTLKDHSKHSDSERQKNCQAAEHGLETKFQSLSTNATSFQTKIDSALANAISYQKDNNLNVTNFTQLVSAAQTAQIKAAASVSILNGLSPTLDCSQSTVATNVAKFKVASKQAKTDLLAYKDAVKAVLQALEAAKGEN